MTIHSWTDPKHGMRLPIRALQQQNPIPEYARNPPKHNLRSQQMLYAIQTTSCQQPRRTRIHNSVELPLVTTGASQVLRQLVSCERLHPCLRLPGKAKLNQYQIKTEYIDADAPSQGTGLDVAIYEAIEQDTDHERNEHDEQDGQTRYKILRAAINELKIMKIDDRDVAGKGLDTALQAGRLVQASSKAALCHLEKFRRCNSHAPILVMPKEPRRSHPKRTTRNAAMTERTNTNNANILAAAMPPATF